ncbi:hypothetical protein [Hyphomicrobium facile]|uniref:General secretion pathway protein N n=1 Tax=Hyphomicrobium facile TaxID=51670 RepID=A0A1I7NRX3_9HYPH|nr:hypothetical protein [Hyphomicrobium facile]SFV37352.1 hypothetical protein SAMN04488557_3119 [Hyphomicrobium facile]
MMEKYRPALLILVSLVLGALTWLDNRAVPVPEATAPAVTAETAAAETPEATTEPEESAEPEEDVASEEPPTSGNPLASFDKASLENWVERPLFAPSRKRPPAQAVADAGPKLQPPPDYRLLGVVLNPHRTIALLRREGTNVDVRVQVGDMIGGWHVASVEREAVTLRRDEDTSQIVRFKKDCANAPGIACP